MNIILFPVFTDFLAPHYNIIQNWRASASDIMVSEVQTCKLLLISPLVGPAATVLDGEGLDDK